MVIEHDRKKKRITFKLEAPYAKEVILLGDFNNWDGRHHIMRRDRDGIWNRAVLLSPGRYEYGFVVDGYSLDDTSHDKTVPLRFRTSEHALTVYETWTHEL
jgi:1,4-alpha-glucan branching enzyme